ncbi:MAG: ATP-dependent zinc protease [Deltaproteobacteria bacterium]|nr:ATP-dependent zinc protease [Deltaproteobacteria bacterium]
MNLQHARAFSFIGIALLFLPLAHASDIVGWVEKVRIYPGNLLVEARIDTGAELSSLHCDCISPYERNGEKWVSFVVVTLDGRPTLMERRVHRTAKIKRHFGEVQERMVIKLGVCLGKTYKEAEVNLVDRSGLTYPMLVGRDFLEGDFLVDPSAEYKIEPQCNEPKK